MSQYRFPQVCCVCNMPHILNEDVMELMAGGTKAAHKRCAAQAKSAVMENVQANMVSELLAGEDLQEFDALVERVTEAVFKRIANKLGVDVQEGV